MSGLLQKFIQLHDPEAFVLRKKFSYVRRRMFQVCKSIVHFGKIVCNEICKKFQNNSFSLELKLTL